MFVFYLIKRIFLSSAQSLPNLVDVPLPNLLNVPLLIFANDRPFYLKKCLKRLLSIPASNPSNFLVSINGFQPETKELVRFFGLNFIETENIGFANAKISQNYKNSLKKSFEIFPKADFLLIIEEDLLVSVDFFHFFAHTIEVFRNDPSVYCISAWNDLGYDSGYDSNNDSGYDSGYDSSYEKNGKNLSAIFRTDYMPGLGWMLSRSIFEQELFPIWPDPSKQWDWDTVEIQNSAFFTSKFHFLDTNF